MEMIEEEIVKIEHQAKAKFKLEINCWMLGISFTIFALIISINPALFKGSFFMPLQLTMSIPLLFSSVFSRARMAYSQKPKLWEGYGFITFLLGYAFLVNIIGILLSKVVGLNFGLAFLGFNVLSSIVYSAFEVIEIRSKLGIRIKKDLLFMIILMLGGVLPSLGLFK